MGNRKDPKVDMPSMQQVTLTSKQNPSPDPNALALTVGVVIAQWVLPSSWFRRGVGLSKSEFSGSGHSLVGLASVLVCRVLGLSKP